MCATMTLLILFVKNYTIPHGLTYTFKSNTCKPVGVVCSEQTPHETAKQTDYKSSINIQFLAINNNITQINHSALMKNSDTKFTMSNFSETKTRFISNENSEKISKNYIFSQICEIKVL